MGKEKKIFFFYMLIKFLYLIIKKKNYFSNKIWKKGAYEINAVIHCQQSNFVSIIKLTLINLNVKFSFVPLLHFPKGISKI